MNEQNNVRIVSRTELLTALLNSKGNTFVQVKTKTKPRIKKSDEVKVSRGVVKYTSVNGIMGFFSKPTDGPRKWGKHITANVITHEKNNEKRYYLQILSNRCDTVKYFDNDGNEYSNDGIKLIKSLLPKRQSNDRLIRNYNLDNIIELRFNKVKYVVN